MFWTKRPIGGLTEDLWLEEKPLALEPRILLDAAMAETAVALHDVGDGSGPAGSHGDTALLNALGAFSAPASQPEIVVDADGSGTDTSGLYVATYYENGDPVAVSDSDIRITADSGVAHAIVTLTNAESTDKLEVSIPNSLGIGAYRSLGAGTITFYLSGDATNAQWAEALQHIRFRADSEDPSDTQRLITLQIQDKTGAFSPIVTTAIDVVPVEDKPVVDLDPGDRTVIGIDYRGVFVEGDDPVSVGHSTGGVSIVDVDDAEITRLRVTLTNAADGDALLFSGVLPLALSIDPSSTSTDILITGSASKSIYQDVLEAILFTNTSDDPDTTTRQIHVSVDDDTTDSPTAKAFIEVQGRNDPPVLVSPIDDQLAVDADGIGTISVAAVFTDVDDRALTYSLGADAPNWLTIDVTTGLVSNNASIPIDASQQTNRTGNPPGTYTVMVTATDQGGATAMDTFDIVVTNPEPVATADRFTISEDDGILAGNVMADNGGGADTDPDGDPLSVTAVAGDAAHVGQTIAGSGGGLFTIQPDGGFTFDGNGDFQHLGDGQSAVSWVTYRITDADGASSATLVEVTVQGANDSPTTNGDIADRIGWDSETVAPVDLSVFFADIDSGDSLIFSGTGLPPGLVIDPATGVLSGTLAANASQTGNAGAPTDGLYSVTVTATDKAGETAAQSFLYKIGNPDPIATDDTLVVTDQGAGSINLITGDTGNGVDTDPDGDAPLTLAAIDGNESLIGTSFAGTGGGLFTVAANGTFSFDTNGDFTSLPKGDSVTTSFTYRLSDGEGGASIATVTVVVVGENQPPEPRDPSGGTPGDPTAYIPVQSLLDGQTAPALDLTPFASDPDRGDTLTFTIDEAALPDGLSFDGTTITGTISPDASQSGTDPLRPGIYRIPLTVTDSHGASFSTWVVYDVSNVPPIAADNSSSGDAVVVQSGNVITDADGPDRDGPPDADPLIVTQIVPVDPASGKPLIDPTTNLPFAPTDMPASGSAAVSLAYGELTMAADGSWQFVPNAKAGDLPPGTSSELAIAYRIDDGQGGTDTAVLTILIEVDGDGAGKPPEDPDDPGADADGGLELSSGKTLGILDVVDGNRTFLEALLQRQRDLSEGDAALYRGAEADVATGGGPADKLTVRSLVWRDTVYVELLGPVTQWSATDGTGQNLPAWIRQTDTNLIAIASGHEQGANSIVVKAAMQDGRVFNLPVRVDQTTGDISLGQIGETALADRPLSDQLAFDRDRADADHDALLQALER